MTGFDLDLAIHKLQSPRGQSDTIPLDHAAMVKAVILLLSFL
jgi:hypothetical protein